MDMQIFEKIQNLNNESNGVKRRNNNNQKNNNPKQKLKRNQYSYIAQNYQQNEKSRLKKFIEDQGELVFLIEKEHKGKPEMRFKYKEKESAYNMFNKYSNRQMGYNFNDKLYISKFYCYNFLKKQCQQDECPFPHLHVKQITCKNITKQACSKENCQFIHVNNSQNTGQQRGQQLQQQRELEMIQQFGGLQLGKQQIRGQQPRGQQPREQQVREQQPLQMFGGQQEQTYNQNEKRQLTEYQQQQEILKLYEQQQRQNDGQFQRHRQFHQDNNNQLFKLNQPAFNQLSQKQIQQNNNHNHKQDCIICSKKKEMVEIKCGCNNMCLECAKKRNFCFYHVNQKVEIVNN